MFLIFRKNTNLFGHKKLLQNTAWGGGFFSMWLIA